MPLSPHTLISEYSLNAKHEHSHTAATKRSEQKYFVNGWSLFIAAERLRMRIRMSERV